MSDASPPARGLDAGTGPGAASSWEIYGGDRVFEPLLRDFYARIAASPLAALFPADLEETMRKQFAFQSEFWGGPVRYSPWRGHPRLRARHLPFPIGLAQAETWLTCMHQAVLASAMPVALHGPYLGQMARTAYAMINQPIGPPPVPVPEA